MPFTFHKNLKDLSLSCQNTSRILKSPIGLRISLIEILMITNQGCWLLIVKIQLSNKLKLIEHQMQIFQVEDDNGILDHALGRQVHSFKEPRIQVQNDKQSRLQTQASNKDISSLG